MKILTTPLLIIAASAHAGNNDAIKTCEIFYQFSNLIYDAKSEGKRMTDVFPVINNYTTNDPNLREKLISLSASIYENDMSRSEFRRISAEALAECSAPYR